jgi:hypothetical protein
MQVGSALVLFDKQSLNLSPSKLLDMLVVDYWDVLRAVAALLLQVEPSIGSVDKFDYDTK